MDAQWWLPPVAAFVISFFTSMVGISGAFLLLPIQISFLALTGPAVSATNLVFNLIAIPAGIYRYWREKRAFLAGARNASGKLPATPKHPQGQSRRYQFY